MPVFAEALGTAFRIDATKDKSVILSRDGSPVVAPLPDESKVVIKVTRKDLPEEGVTAPPPKKTPMKIDPAMIVAGVAGVGLVVAAVYLLRSKPAVPVEVT